MRSIIIGCALTGLVSAPVALASEPVRLSDSQLDLVSAGNLSETFQVGSRSYAVSVQTAFADGTLNMSTTQSLAESSGGDTNANASGSATSNAVESSGSAAAQGGSQNNATSYTAVAQSTPEDFRTTASVGSASAGPGGSSSASSGGAANSSDDDIFVSLSSPGTAAGFSSNGNDGVSYASANSTGSASSQSVVSVTSGSLAAVAAR
jgi:hypothetical protein